MPYPYKSIREWFSDEEKLGNLVRISTPIKCGDYSNLVDIGFEKYNKNVPDPRGEMKGVLPETEVRAVSRYLHSLPRKPIGIIEKPIDNRPDIPVVVNIWPNYERTLRGMGLKDKFELVEKIANLQNNRIKPVTVPKGKAACKQVIIPEDKIDLTKDIPRVWAEFNKLCFTGCNGTIISYDPEIGTHGLTKTRLGFFDWDNGDPNQPFSEEKVKKYGHATMARPGRPGQGNTGRYYFEKYRDKDKPWPTAFVYGIPTDAHVLAAVKSLRWPETGDEYEIIGGFRGEPVELVESETIPGLMVPAYAEWVIEGEFVSEDYRTPVSSEDLLLGFIWGEALWPLFRVKCITHRKDPLWTAATFSSLGHQDHQGVHSGLLMGVNADVINMLRKMGYKVKDVVTLAQWVMVVQLEVDGSDKPHPGYGEEVGRLVGAKYTIVVGPDIDPYNLEEVLWAVGMRAGRSEWRDYPLPPPGSPPIPRYGIFNEVTTDMGFLVIDATIPVPERFDTFAPRTEPPAWENEAIERMKKKLGQL
ncbi:MAG TPA: UbiD family decarboxylase [Dehalococcoidia bacterium]|nr:UbiD family decarboxylase [Dehalococcoidia bacterium]